MATFHSLLKPAFLLALLAVLAITISAADQADVTTTSCTSVAAAASPILISFTFTTFLSVPKPTTIIKTTTITPTPELAPPEPEPEPEPEPFIVEAAPPPLATPTPAPPPLAPNPPHRTPYAPPPQPQNIPPSTTWRYDRNSNYPQPRPTPKPCNVLNDMAFARYRYTMELCQKAAVGDPAVVKEIIVKLGGFDFRRGCRVEAPVGCCFDVYEMLNAERCYYWWPNPETPEYYEPGDFPLGRK